MWHRGKGVQHFVATIRCMKNRDNNLTREGSFFRFSKCRWSNETKLFWVKRPILAVIIVDCNYRYVKNSLFKKYRNCVISVLKTRTYSLMQCFSTAGTWRPYRDLKHFSNLKLYQFYPWYFLYIPCFLY